MIKNYNNKDIQATIARTYFRSPTNLCLKQQYNDNNNQDFFDDVKWLQHSREYNKFSCCLCYQVLEDPRLCGNCGIYYCATCKMEMDRYILCCPNYRCFSSDNCKPSQEYMKIYNNLYVECQNQGCHQLFHVVHDQQKQQEHFSSQCQYKKLRCKYCKDFPIQRMNMQTHLQQYCNIVPKVCSVCKIEYKQSEQHNCIEVMAQLIDKLERQVQENQIQIAQMRDEIIKDRNMNML